LIGKGKKKPTATNLKLSGELIIILKDAKSAEKYMRKKRTGKQLLRSRADRAWFVAVFRKWGNACGACGERGIQAHHFYPKGLYPALRYDLENGIPICMRCHFMHHHRGDPSIGLLITANRGKKWLAGLEKRKRNEIYWTIKEYEDNIKRLEI